MGHISATLLSAGAQAGKSQALALSRAAADRAQAATGRAPKEFRDVVKLSHKALRIIDKVEAKVNSVDVNSSRGAEKMANLQKKIGEALDKLFEKAAKAGITLVVEDDAPAPEAPASKAAAPEAPAPKAAAPKAAVASERELVSAAPAPTPAPGAAKSETLSVAANPGNSGLRSANSGSGKPGLVAATTTDKTTGQARAAEVRSNATDNASAASAKAEESAANKAEKRIVVIKASVLKEITNFEALSRLIADTDAKLNIAAGASAEEAAKMETVQTVLREASVDVASADIRALKTYRTMVDLMENHNRQVSDRYDDNIARRNHIDFAA